VGEESHLDEMRSAIRGDFERLARRRGDQELLHVPDASLPDDESDVAEPEAEPQRRSWLERLFAP
jgi:predicted anti-sigma-YlaC factor YlaD